MCENRTRPEDTTAGRLIELCPDFAQRDHLTAHVPMSNVRWTPITERVLSTFRGANVAILEADYFDSDYRSEFSATHETTFAVRNPSTVRALFFSNFDGDDFSLRRVAQAATRQTTEDADSGGASNASSPRTASARASDPFPNSASCQLLGYTVLRPQSPGGIGRSILPPPPDSPELKDPERIGHRVRTGVSEEIEVFGERLTARGTPFIEQDGQLLRCVHAAAWMTHYTATLRGLTSRKRTAEIHQAEDDSFVLGRRFPSPGLTDEALNRVLGRIGIPAIFIDYNSLTFRRPPNWYDRAEVWERQDELDFWITENLTAVVCRYLNSGLPIILARNDNEHALVVCGYVRAEDLAELQDEDEHDPSRVAKFIVHDDQVGPYEFQSVEELGEALTNDPASISLLAPVPPGLWLSGSDAEILGAEMFETALAERLANFETWCEHHGVSGEHEVRREELEGLESRLTSGYEAGQTSHGTLAIRSSALTGSDFKRSFMKLVGDELAADIAGLAKLPKYVWVVEVFDRTQRDDDSDGPAVVGTVVIDASTGIKRETELKAVHTLFVHFAGMASTKPHSVRSEDWLPVASHRRFSCRWHHERTWLLEARAIAIRAKSAG